MIIVFGAAGFVGTYLVDQLATHGFDVLATDVSELGEAYYQERKIPFIRLDITREEEFSKLPREGASSVVDLACLQPANVSKDEYNPTNYIKVNVMGTVNILEFCRKTKIPKIIYVSSHQNVRGLWGLGKPISENDPRAIKYTGEYAVYSISESAAIDCVEHYRQQYGMQGIIFRLPPVYGYGPYTEIFKNGKPVKTGFQVFIESAIVGKPLEVWGDCRKGRDIVYVKDVVSAIVLALDSENAVGLYNIASGRLLSLEEEARGIISVFSPTDRPSEIVYRPDKVNSVEPFLYDISKAKRDLGWSPTYSFEDMLIDYKREMESGRFKFLLEKRQEMIRVKGRHVV
jgi:UDP-glucose 4-epimerase